MINLTKDQNIEDFKKIKFDILFLIGQSNAEGNGAGNEELISQVDPRLKSLMTTIHVGYVRDLPKCVNGSVVYKLLDLTNNEAAFTNMGYFLDNSPRTESFGYTFAKLYKEKYLTDDRSLLIIMTGTGGTGFGDNMWTDGGRCKEAAFNLLELALSLNKDNRLVGVLWHQGEHDSVCEEYPSLEVRKETYRKNILHLFDDINKKFNTSNIPTISGEFVNEWADKNPSTKAIEDVLHEIKESIPHYDCVSSDGLESNNQTIGNGDDIHFSRLACIELGKRYFEKYEELLKGCK